MDKAYNKQYYEQNREKEIARKKAYYHKHAAYFREMRRERYRKQRKEAQRQKWKQSLGLL